MGCLRKLSIGAADQCSESFVALLNILAALFAKVLHMGAFDRELALGRGLPWRHHSSPGYENDSCSV